MTEQEQIEEMAHVINNRWRPIDAATKLYNMGYQKVDEGVLYEDGRAVLLTEKRYDKLREIELNSTKEIAKEILTEVDNALHDLGVEYANSEHLDYFAVCEYIHHKVIRKIADKQGVEVE